ncbi:PA14 domain-containing protein [Streptomyces cadmiisoli]|uniref:Cellulose 1,4-beta-cellobiosidase n=1 Tax=Streptomyces cadmiisoli TaxID=2184053 RepID=A0A2Z4J0A0_9ACTN|nr:PA14 domain-containing protein [Streptomyces cadmiisoli]AWW38490.1 cellulose 1,4-beta-cellobiosidase [Streptomyces cadmiisoli]
MNPARRTTSAAATAVVLATAGGLLTAAAAPASAATTCTSPVFKRQFYANTSFSGTPKKTDCDSAVDQNWGTGAPASGLPKDKFGVRWTVTRDFGSGGPFTFTASAQDGVRVYLDGKPRIDLWKNVSSTVSKTVNVTIPKGKHALRVDFVNVTGRANVKFTYAPRTSASVDKVAPLVPTGAAVTYDQATGKAKLTWAKNKEMDLAGYRVYRRAKGGSSPGTRLTTTTSTSYTDATLPVTGAAYEYTVRAVDKAGHESAGTATLPVTTTDRTAPEPLGELSSVGTTAGNALTWEASPSSDVHHYEVWAAPAGQQDPDGPATVFGTSWTDVVAEAGTEYRYTVLAVDGARNVSPASVVTATRPVPSGAPAPTGVQGTPADAHTRLTWAPAEGDIGGYRVYRRTDPNGAWNAIGDTGSAAGSYEDTSAPRGKAYYYVATVDGAGAESVPSAAATVDRLTPATAAGPAAPRLTVNSQGGTRFPISVGVEPGAGDEQRLLKGYLWEISGACGSSGPPRLTTTDTISWIPSATGPCAVAVRAVDAYGRTGQEASVEVMVAR